MPTFFSPKTSQKGFVLLSVIVLMIIILLGIGISISSLTFRGQYAAQNLKRSLQAYFSAEAGIEDALLRLSKAMSWSSPYTISVEGTSVQVTISNMVGGARTITGKGDDSARIRKVQTVYAISSSSHGFFYGAQVGDAGIEMENNSQIIGNVFSNGNIIAQPGSQITGTAKVAGAGHRIERATIGNDAFVDICQNSSIGDELHANSQTGCSYGSLITLGSPPSPEPLPISNTQISAWKTDAETGGVISGDYNLSGSSTASLGPKKIIGNLIVQNNAILTITGTLWVTGNVDIKNNAQVRLYGAIYDTLSGVIISDGMITLQNDSISSGSGQPGSYLMYLSTASLNPALEFKNNAKADILYTSNGWAEIENNAALKEITAYGLRIENNATVTYESGLADAVFSSGADAGWSVTSWKEVE
ncbi:MAG: hypothetical protein AAB567_03390 [Patescibacteria group bacterium]|mgnify:CR=1 FL=1